MMRSYLCDCLSDWVWTNVFSMIVTIYFFIFLNTHKPAALHHSVSLTISGLLPRRLLFYSVTLHYKLILSCLTQNLPLAVPVSTQLLYLCHLFYHWPSLARADVSRAGDVGIIFQHQSNATEPHVWDKLCVCYFHANLIDFYVFHLCFKVFLIR